MAGTVQGGKNAAATNKAKHGEDFYKRIGAEGGKKGKTGGFYANRELARSAGAKGGAISRRGKSKPKPAVRKPVEKKVAKITVVEKPTGTVGTVVPVTVIKKRRAWGFFRHGK